MKLDETFMHFLLDHQQRHNRTLNFLILMESILTSARYIQHYYNMAALEKNLGGTGEINVQGESVMKLDDISHQIVVHCLKESKQVMEATSEESAEPIRLHEDGRYFIYFDPLDGSSNVQHSLPVGFLFGIGKRNLNGDEDYHLRTGREFIAAGMFLIPSGIFTFALKNAGMEISRNESGEFVRPSRVMFPESIKTRELSFNSGNLSAFAPQIQNWVNDNSSKNSFRYAGALAVDFHRLLNNGGLFMYPAILNHADPKKNRPEGKLRLLYECSVVAFIANEAGGAAINEAGENILDVEPGNRHQRSSLYVGNKKMIKSVGDALKA